jgi:integrase
MVRRHGHGTIFQRSSDGRIVGRLPDGRGGHRYVSRPDLPGAREEVRRELDAMRRERDRSLRSTGTGRGGERLRDLLERYLDTIAPTRVRARTLEGYRQIARDHLIPNLGPLRVAQLDPADAQRLVERMTAAGHAPTTVRNAVVLLSAVLRQAMREGGTDRNVASLAILPRQRSRTLPSLTTEQVADFIEATRGERFWPVWTLAATTGMRISEALGLRWSDVTETTVTITGQYRRGAIVEGEDGPEREWLREPTKTERSRRTVHLPPHGVEAMAEAKAAARSPVHVFARSDGAPVDRSAVTKAFHKALTKHGLPSVRFHSLRHAAASGMLEATGGDLRAVSAVLGHASINTTIAVYGKEADEARKRAAEAWGRALVTHKRVQEGR